MTVPAPYAALVADAAIFPPGDLPLDQALVAHSRHLAAQYAGLVAGFVVDDRRLGDLAALRKQPGSPADLDLNVVVTGGAGAVAPALTWAARCGTVRTVEIALRDLDNLAANVQRIGAAAEVPDGAEVYVELPRCPQGPGHGWLAAADEVAAQGFGLKLRTGGLTADDFPAADELAACIDAALDRELAFRCTAGLHHALPNREDGLPHHGFLNVLLATRAALDGEDVEGALAAGPNEVVERLADTESIARARRWFTGFGSCSISDPVHDLTELGLWEVAA